MTVKPDDICCRTTCTLFITICMWKIRWTCITRYAFILENNEKKSITFFRASVFFNYWWSSIKSDTKILFRINLLPNDHHNWLFRIHIYNRYLTRTNCNWKYKLYENVVSLSLSLSLSLSTGNSEGPYMMWNSIKSRHLTGIGSF